MDVSGMVWTAILAAMVVLYVLRRRARLSHEDVD